MKVLKFLTELYQKIKNRNRIEKPLPIGYITFKNQIIGEVMDRTAPIPKSDYKPEVFVSKIMFDTKSTPLIFERGFVQKIAQQEPFQMVILDGRNKSVYYDCMIKKLRVAYPSHNVIIAEGVELVADEVRYYLR